MKKPEINIDVIKEVELLDLKFPIATITKLTGFGKSTVSEILNGKRAPSPRFKKMFYELLVNKENFVNEKNFLKNKVLKCEITQDDLNEIYRQGALLAESLKKQVENNNEILELLKKHFNPSS